MTFEETLDQTIVMLQRWGRLTYSTLKRQFQLDDMALDDLKHELIQGQRLATDEEGGVLVWTGAVGLPSVPAPSALPPSQQDDRVISGTALLASRSVPEAERRQLTVMFCDLVDSTVLANSITPT